MNTNTFLRQPIDLVTSVRDALRERREARADRRVLERELACYTTPAEVNDLLGSLRGQDDRAVQDIRDAVVRNLLRHSLHRAS